ncbi:hypothetical protein [Pseudoclavibacter sp. 13-3]|uniref:hypothetical protein n=1 Tax=Pseudoclavibacter sp. 13-3 TaxID=2901228 RepID=UPI001E555351|nr:hypothetical protein [Pseudoclavibacter sp. 13-3]MCD7101129.1 hypothetical protein [Pseudoclavibacter sp. 13-3]
MARKSQESTQAGLFGQPQVNLLPPGQVRRLDVRSARRLIVILGISFVVANGVLIAYGGASQAAVNRQLASAQQQSQQLQSELAANSEAINLAGDIRQLENARIAVTARETDLQQLLSDVRDSTPANMQITTFNLQSVGASRSGAAASGSGASASSDRPSAANIGSISIEATSDDLPNISQWIDNVRKVHGVAGITAQNVKSQDQSAGSSEASADGASGFVSNLTIVLSADVFTHRFAQGADAQTSAAQTAGQAATTQTAPASRSEASHD